MRFAFLAAALFVLAASGSVGAPAGPRLVTLEAIAVACPGRGDGICLAYNGSLPGPTLALNLGERVQLTLVNHIAQTIWSVPGDDQTRARLANASISFHAHGMALGVESDGMMPMGDANFPLAVAPPGGSYTYSFRAAYNGTWHYHDHVLGPDGAEGIARGLVGLIVVRAGAELRPDLVLDVQCADGACMTSPTTSVPAGGAFEAGFVVLGDHLWRFEIGGRSLELGPGQSEHVVVTNARGVYAWSATDESSFDVVTGQVNTA